MSELAELVKHKISMFCENDQDCYPACISAMNKNFNEFDQSLYLVELLRKKKT